MKIRIVKPDFGTSNTWPAFYRHNETVEIDLDEFPRWLTEKQIFGQVTIKNEIAIYLNQFIQSKLEAK
jgi:hypothetical protein